MAIPAATPALIERVEPYCVIEQTIDALAAAAGVRPTDSCPNSNSERRGRVVDSNGVEPGRLSIATTVYPAAAA